jgi:hypothetical protein
MKRTLLFVLIFLPMLASADVVEIGGIYYELVPKAKAAAVVKNPNGYTGSVVIPASVIYDGKEYSVTRIADAAFAGCNALTTVTIPEGVNTLEQHAFWYSSLTSITIPGSVKSIGDWAFYCCDCLTSATLSDGVASIGNYAFSNCGKLASVTIPNSVTSIGGSAFSECASLASVTIPDGVTDIFAYSFSGCSNITSITIPSGVTSIGGYAFHGCSGLTSITIPGSVATMDRNTFSRCSSLASVTFSGGELSIARDAFKDCDALAEVHVPDLESWFKITFENAYSSPLFTAQHLYVGSEEIKGLMIPDGVKSIGAFAFYCLTALDSVTIPSSVTSIGKSAFLGCTGLSSIAIPNSVTSIGESAFGNCSGLTTLALGNNVTSIGQLAFAGCSGLTSLTIPDGVTSLETSTFTGCSGLTTVTIPNGVKTIKDGAFRYCSGLTTLTIGSGVTSIGTWAFAFCPELMDVYCLAENVPYIRTSSSGFGVFEDSFIEYATLHVPAVSVSAYQAVEPWKNFQEIVALPTQDDYRPFVEDDKVWKVGGIGSNPVQLVEYYYFDGDTIIGGKTCKQMMRQRYVNAEHPDYAIISLYPLLSYVGAWYEEDKKVYAYDSINNQFLIKYDFSLNANDTILIDNYHRYVVGPRQTGGIKGFKGVHRDVMISNIYNTTWLEGVGGIDGPTRNVYYGKEGHPLFLMSCVVGDEVLYNNEDFEDGATPEGARKGRFDFTHTIKTKPQTPNRREAEPSIYGEYSDKLLAINLNPLGDAYMVRITDETGTAVYEKAINAGIIVGLNIDISSYTRGRYVVTVENNHESFTGEFEVQTSGIENHVANETPQGDSIYNLQGQRIATLQKGLNIVNGKKVYNRN